MANTLVSHILEKYESNPNQKKLLRPWLNTIANLTIGFIPRIGATGDGGLEYRYPSMGGHKHTYYQGGYQRIDNNKSSVFVAPGEFKTPRGTFPAEVKTKYLKLATLTFDGETLNFIFEDENGKESPVTIAARMSEENNFVYKVDSPDKSVNSVATLLCRF